MVAVGSICLVGLAFLREDFRFGIYSALVTPLYTKLEKDDIFDQTNRRDIYSYLVKKPGANLSTIFKELDMGYGTLVHHLRVLERENHIRSRKVMGRKMFFPKNSNWNPERDMINIPLSPIQIRILEYLRKNGPTSAIELEKSLFLKRQTVTYSVDRLIDRGAVERSGRGRRSLINTSGESGIRPVS